MKNNIIILLIIFGTSLAAEAQNHRFFVYFKDKQTKDYPYSIDKPSEFLTQRALDRRKKNNVSIVENDLPVNPAYVKKVADLGVDVFFSSRWLNGCLVQTDSSKLAEIKKLSEVDSIALIAEKAKLTRDKTQKPPVPQSFEKPSLSTANINSNFQLQSIGVHQMHKEKIKGKGVLIAILDNGYTGVNKFEPFEQIWKDNRIVATKDFVGNQGNVFQYGAHGTSVFSIIGATYQKGEAIFSGSAPDASFVLCVTEEGGSEDRVEEYNWVLGAEYADSLGADVINSSLGYFDFDIKKHNYTKADLDGKTAISTVAADIAASKGIVVVISAGNEGTSAWKTISPPADAKNILAIGSFGTSQDPFSFIKTSFSSVGPTADKRIKPEVAAFGLATTNMNGGGKIKRGSGTSFSAPLIAGLAAGIIEKKPEWTQQKIREMIIKSANQYSNPDSLLGYGVPNYTYAINGKQLNISDIYHDKLTVYPNPFTGNTLYLNVQGKFKEGIHIRVFDTAYGDLVYETRISRKDAHGKIPLTFDNIERGLYIMDIAFGEKHSVVKLINF